MKKKLITISVIFLLLSIVLPVAVTAESNTGDYDIKKSVLRLKSDVTVEWDSTEFSEPIIPESDTKTIELKIKYKTVYSFKLSTIFTNLMKNRQIDVNIEILESPEWCISALDKTIISTTVSTEEKNLSANLSIYVTEGAIAYQSGEIKLNVSVEPQKGLLGALLFISGYNEIYEISVTPGFLPEISAEIDYINYTKLGTVELPPYNETKIPIKISNLGNAKTKVLAEIIDVPENWTVNLDPYVILDMDTSSQIELSVEADHKFDDKTITVQLTPVRNDDVTDKGESINLTINLHNDGSYKEPEEEFEIDTTMLAIILLAIILIIIIAIVFIKRK